MKKIVKTTMIAALVMFAAVLVAQTVIRKYAGPYRWVNGSGTRIVPRNLSGFDTVRVYWPNNYKHDLIVELKNTKVSGTVAGTAEIRGTNDTTLTWDKWEPITGVTTQLTNGKTTSMTLSDGTVYGRWHIPRAQMQWIGVGCISSVTTTVSTPSVTVTYGY